MPHRLCQSPNAAPLHQTSSGVIDATSCQATVQTIYWYPQLQAGKLANVGMLIDWPLAVSYFSDQTTFKTYTLKIIKSCCQLACCFAPANDTVACLLEPAAIWPASFVQAFLVHEWVLPAYQGEVFQGVAFAVIQDCPEPHAEDVQCHCARGRNVGVGLQKATVTHRLSLTSQRTLLPRCKQLCDFNKCISAQRGTH